MELLFHRLQTVLKTKIKYYSLLPTKLKYEGTGTRAPPAAQQKQMEASHPSSPNLVYIRVYKLAILQDTYQKKCLKYWKYLTNRKS